MLNKLEKALGYKFRDPELLRMALTHTSVQTRSIRTHCAAMSGWNSLGIPLSAS